MAWNENEDPEGRWRHVAAYAGVAIATVLVIAAAAGYGAFLHYEEPAKPKFHGELRRGVLRMGEIIRTFAYYVPVNLAENPPLVLAFHGSRSSGEEMREHLAYELDELADQRGFIVVYPDGYERHWNDCRRAAPYSARKLGINDVGLVRGLVRRFADDYGADPSAAFAVGFSNGAHLVYRLALEIPHEIAGAAVIGSALPTDDNCDCPRPGMGVPLLLVAGTDDPINPFQGGAVTIFGMGNRGTVLSMHETAEYFARVAGYDGEPVIERFPERDTLEDTWVERICWNAPDRPEVNLLVVHGGGHTIPQDRFEFPRLYGRTSSEVNAPEEIWLFFDRQLEKRRQLGTAGD